jgi:hypothetical protein
MYRSVPHILSIRTDSFHIFSVYKQIHSMYSQYTNSEILFKDLPHFAYSLYTSTYRFFPWIHSIRTDSFRICAVSFRVLGECAQIILNIRNGIIFFIAFKGIVLQKKYVCVQLNRRPTRNNLLFGPTLTKKFLSAYSDNMRNDLQIQIFRRIRIYF